VGVFPQTFVAIHFFCLYLRFVDSDKKTHVLPPMPPERRKFVHDVSFSAHLNSNFIHSHSRFSLQVFIEWIRRWLTKSLIEGLCSQKFVSTSTEVMMHSVRLFRRLDTRIPSPLLSSITASPNAAPPSLGKLVDMRGSTTASSWRSSSTPTLSKPSMANPATGPTRGLSAMTQQMSAAAESAPTPISGGSIRPLNTHIVSMPALSALVPASHNPSEVANVPDNWEDDV
jgi:transcriptional repressor NF-X1